MMSANMKVEDEMQNSFQSFFFCYYWILLEEAIGNHDFATCSCVYSAGSVGRKMILQPKPCHKQLRPGSLRMVMKTHGISHIGRVDFMPLHIT